MNKSCPICDTVYEADEQRLKHGRQTTCSRSCSYTLRSRKMHKGYAKVICRCGKEFVTNLSRPKKSCSRTCQYRFVVITKTRCDKGVSRKPLTEYKCFFCNKRFFAKCRKKLRVFCNRKCYERQKSIDVSGKNNHMYGKLPVRCRNWKQKWVTIGSQKYFFRSTWEVAVAQYLEKEHIDWKYEYQRYKLSNDLTFTPDFFIMKDGQIEKIIEVKGWVKPKDRRKMRLFKSYYDTPIEMWSFKKLRKLGLINGSGYVTN